MHGWLFIVRFYRGLRFRNSFSSRTSAPARRKLLSEALLFFIYGSCAKRSAIMHSFRTLYYFERFFAFVPESLSRILGKAMRAIN